MTPESQFTLLENNAIGRNISMYRKIRGVKAVEVAKKLGLKEAAYTRYERGEVALTINIVKQVAEILKVDPLSLLAQPTTNFVENGNNSSTNSVVSLNSSNWQTTSEEQTKMMMALMQSVTALSERLTAMLEKKMV
jgi:transcriptional regulator with XRE-family HTH domain